MRLTNILTIAIGLFIGTASAQQQLYGVPVVEQASSGPSGWILFFIAVIAITIACAKVIVEYYSLNIAQSDPFFYGAVVVNLLLSLTMLYATHEVFMHTVVLGFTKWDILGTLVSALTTVMMLLVNTIMGYIMTKWMMPYSDWPTLGGHLTSNIITVFLFSVIELSILLTFSNNT